ncbi:hypothetical protein OBK24_06735 [Empedobacter falsenii]
MGAAIYIYNEGGDFIDGFKNGYNSTRKYKKMRDLTNSEMKFINGGDKFTKDLGDSIGRFFGKITNSIEDFAISLGEYRGNY